MNLNLSNLIKIVLAVLFFLCLADMPYGFYQFVRFAAMIGFAYLAFLANKKDEVFIYVGLALLFQPFMKITLGRTIWNIVDVIVGIFLLLSIFRVKKD
jgi:hypothetical protein